MRLIQYREADGTRKVAVSTDEGGLCPLRSTRTTYDLAIEAIRSKTGLQELVQERTSAAGDLDFEKLASQNRLLPPLQHPDPAHCLVSGTGLNHLGSALARDAMHAGSNQSRESDSLKMFKLGLEGGKPKEGDVGVQPEWFYKGDGSCIVPPGQELELPSFALDGGEEAELVGLYVISESGEVFRVGFALGNEYSDHALEKENYLYLAHSKLRDCSMGPELLVGTLPASISGSVRVTRDGETIWSSQFLTGEANMTHSIANLEHHHFKYATFRRPGDVHCHFFGASILSFSAGIRAEPGDVFEISSPQFGHALTNPVGNARTGLSAPKIRSL